MIGTCDVEFDRAADTEILGFRDRIIDTGAGTGNDDLSGGIEVCDIDSGSFGEFADFSSSPPISAAMEPSVALQASSIKVPRRETRWSPSSKENVPAAAWAVNSPSESPAAATGLKFGKRDFNNASPIRP